MIDMVKCKRVFFDYIKNYDMSDPKINLKVIHTLHVMESALYIADELNLDDENKSLSLLIALLHDIGQFEQLKQYATFEDRKSFNHAEYGIEILFKNNLIREYITSNIYDKIIYKAIINHNRYEIETGLSDLELLHVKILRDADKLDNFRVEKTEEIRNLLDKPEEEIGKQIITKSVMEDFLSCHLVNRKNVQNELDSWISNIAFVFDINFEVTLEYLCRKRYIEELFDRIPYTNPCTITQIEKLKEIVNNYLKKESNKELVGNYGK